VDGFTTVKLGTRELVTDTEMAVIVETLWRLGIPTGRANKPRPEATGDPEHATWGSIWFRAVGDFVAFLDLFDGTPLQWRRTTFMNRPQESGHRTSEYKKWRYTTVVRPIDGKTESVTVSPGVYFPPEDLDEMQSLLTQLLADREAGNRRPRHTHSTELVTVGDRSAEIDVELARIIESLWKLGIDTRACCQDETANLKRRFKDPRGYILFETSEDLWRFLTLLDGTAASDHRWQNFDWADGVGGPVVEVPPIGWTYRINVRRPGPKRDGIEIGASVRFPVGDIPMIEATLSALVLKGSV